MRTRDEITAFIVRRRLTWAQGKNVNATMIWKNAAEKADDLMMRHLLGEDLHYSDKEALGIDGYYES